MSNIEEIEPNLARENKNNPFVVPEGYFDSLPSRVQSFCQNESTKSQTVRWQLALRTQIALAAGFCFFVFLAFAGYYFLKPIGNKNYFDRVDLVKVVVESGTEFDELQLYEAATNNAKKDTVKYRPQDELIEYIMHNNIDYVTLREHSKEIKP